jgi:hypothetical protein
MWLGNLWVEKIITTVEELQALRAEELTKKQCIGHLENLSTTASIVEEKQHIVEK